MEQSQARAARRRGGRRGLPRAVTIMLALTLALAMGALALAAGGDDPARPATGPAAASPPPVTVSVQTLLGDPGSPVPARFLGLSFEVTDLRQIAAYGQIGDFARMLRSLGPGVLRFGGVSADTRITWTDRRTPRPAWTTRVLEAPDLSMLAKLAQASGWRVLLTVGLGHYNAASAARETAAASRALGSSLAGIEVGNEPDAYGRHGLRSHRWNFARYAAEVRSYRRAIARLVPGIPLAGPGVSGSRIFARWGPREASSLRPVLLTGHHYPLGCNQVPAPSIERLLSPAVRAAEVASLRRYMRVSLASGIPFRMDETNSVSCGGEPGISNTFAATLWAANYIAQAMTAGVSGINFEGNPANCLGYSPVCAPTAATLASGALRAQPLWYALLLTRGLVGDRPLRTIVGSSSANVAVSALRAPGGGLRFVAVEEDPQGSAPVTLALRLGSGFSSASVQALRAPSLSATEGITLAGRAIAADGSFAATPAKRSVALSGGVAHVTLPAGSAALISVAPAGG